MVRRALAADADVLALVLAGLDGTAQHGFHGRVALVEVGRQQLEARVAVQAQRELGQVVRADREAVEVLEELVGQDGVARHLAHHDQLEIVVAALEAVLGQQAGHALGLAQRAHEGHHDLHVGQAHVVAHALERLAFHGEGLAEVLAEVARGAAEAQHRVLFLGLVAAAADQLAVLVRLEVRQAHDHLLGPEGRGDGGDALGHLVDVEGARRGMAAGHRLDGLLEVVVDIRVVEDRLRVHADVVVDDELEPREAHAVIGQLREVEGQLRVADVHHQLDVDLGHHAALDLGDLGLEQAVVDVAGVALGAAHGDQGAVLQQVGGVAAADHGRNAQFARDDGRVAGAPAAVGDDGRGALHHRLPVRVGHVGDQHVAGLHLVHLADAVDQPHRAGADLLADRAALGQHGAAAQQLEALLGLALLLAFHGLGTGLEDVDLAVGAVLAPFDVHRAAVVLLDHQRVFGELLDLVVGQRIAVALLGLHVGGLDQLARGLLLLGRGEFHLDQLGAQVAADHRALAGTQGGLVDVELVGVHGTLHHGLAQAVARGDEHHVLEARLGVDGEHHAGRAEVGAHHALHAGRQRHHVVGEALVHAVADGAVVVEGGEHLLHLVQHVLDADDVQEGFLLAGEGGVG